MRTSMPVCRWIVSLAVAVGALPSKSWAQWAGSGGSAAEQRLRCESVQGREQFCPARNDGSVRLIRSYGSVPCREGSNWRPDRNGIWVREGCRGEFGFYPAGGTDTGSGDGWSDEPVEVRCASNDGRENFCAIDNRSVTLRRTESRAPCVQGSTWRYTNAGIYVREGCRGVFSVRPRASGGGWGGGGGWESDGGWQANYRVKCQSIGGRWGACPVDIRGPVRLVKQESRATCERGWTWGTIGSEAIWVSEGCRAVFEIQNGRASTSGRKDYDGPGSAPPGITRQKME
jgi:hypothetical protein